MNITHEKYEILLNLIGYWLISNKKTFKKRNLYEYQGRTADLATIENALLSRKKNPSEDGLTGRYVEASIVDNNNHDFLPNYVTYQNKQYPKANIINMVQRVLIYEQQHGTIPRTVETEITKIPNTTNNNTNNTLKPYLTSTGCAGMGQCTSYYCACNSLQQAFYRLTGIQVAESTIASIAGTTSGGTSHQGINTVIAWFNQKYNENLTIEWKNFSELGNTQTERFTKLQKYIDTGAVFFHLLYRNQYGHYEVPKTVNTNNKTITVLNSLGNKCKAPAYCGYIENRSFNTQQSYINGISQKSVCIITRGK